MVRANSRSQFLTLALESSTALGGVALAKGQQILGSLQFPLGSRHSDSLLTGVHQLLEKVQLNLKDLDCIAVDVGPGSFTGIRVGVNAARAFGYALKLPLFAMTSLEILAQGCAPAEKEIMSLLNSHRDIFFGANFSPQGDLKGPIRTYRASELSSDWESHYVCAGNGFKRARVQYPEASVLAVQPARKGKALAWKEVHPLYLRSFGPDENEKIARQQGVPK